MTVPEFLELFIKELEVNHELREYYRLLNDKNRFLWRKAYFQQRLDYVNRHIDKNSSLIWDAGCGYATTAIFLTLNGHTVHGNTLEFYFERIKPRLEYWSRFGNLDKLHVEYANLFDMPVREGYYDYIIAQDTLHHLEPIRDALDIFGHSLNDKGKLVVTEENGNCILIGLKNFMRRGFNKVSYYYDERLGKSIPFGNENARSMRQWNELLNLHGFDLPRDEIEYIRLYPHFYYKNGNQDALKMKEAGVSRTKPALRELLFFGISFVAVLNAQKLNDMDDQYRYNPVEVFAGNQWEASLVKSLLENAQVEAFLKDEIRGTTMPWQVTPGGIAAVKVVVARKDLEIARQVVSDFETNRNRRED